MDSAIRSVPLTQKQAAALLSGIDTLLMIIERPPTEVVPYLQGAIDSLSEVFGFQATQVQKEDYVDPELN